MVKAGLLGAPEAALDKAIAAAPARAEARSLRADLRFRSGRYRGAELDAQAAAQPGAAPAAWAMLVRSAARSRGPDAGIEAAERGIAAAGRDPGLLQPLAILWAERRRAPEAVRMLEEIIRGQGDSAAALSAQVTLARIRLRGGDRETARRALDTLLERHPAEEEALALRVALEASEGRIDASVSKLDAAVRLAPSSRALRELRARLQAARADRGAVAALLQEQLDRDLGPAPVPAARIRAETRSGHARLASLGLEHWPGRLAQFRQALEAQLRQRNWTAAQAVVESARSAVPDAAFPAFLAGILELARGNLAEGESALRQSLAAAPRSAVIVNALAKAWSLQKGAAFAGEQLMLLAERDPGFGFARYLAARAYMDSRDPIKAEAAIRRGLVLQPDSAEPYLKVAEYYLDLDRPADVLDICAQGLDRFPQDVDLRLMLARVSADLGRAPDAARLYDEVLSRRPDLDLVEYKLAALVGAEEKDDALAQRAPPLAQLLQGDQPSDPLLLDTLGWLHSRAGHATRARTLLEAAVRGAPEEPAPHYHLAAVYAREKKLDLARGELKAALDSNRPFPERLEAMRLLRDAR